MDALTLRKRLTCLAVAASLCMAASAASARVVKITIDSTTPVSNGDSFGNVGPYELLRGTAYGEIDPADRHNVIITDITLAQLAGLERGTTAVPLTRLVRASHE